MAWEYLLRVQSEGIDLQAGVPAESTGPPPKQMRLNQRQAFWDTSPPVMDAKPGVAVLLFWDRDMAEQRTGLS